MERSRHSVVTKAWFSLIAAVILLTCHGLPASAKPAPTFTTCEALPGLTPVQVMVFSGPAHDNLDNFIMPDSEDGVTEDTSKPPRTFWALPTEGQPWNIVCGYVDSKSKAATNSKLLEPDSIIKHIEVPVPQDVTSCSITFTPGPDPGFPNVKNVECELKPGSHAPQKPDRS